MPYGKLSITVSVLNQIPAGSEIPKIIEKINHDNNCGKPVIKITNGTNKMVKLYGIVFPNEIQKITSSGNSSAINVFLLLI